MESSKNKTSCVCDDKSLLKDRALLSSLLETMMTVRKFEEKILELFAGSMVHGTTHLGIGEEATCAGTTAALACGDYMLTSHRGHGHAIGRGCDAKRVMAEILGKDAGICRGRGGSMHISDVDRGILVGNGILGANAPLACGAALTIKKKNIPNRVSVVFFGDGASNEGAVHESMNLAAAWNLPVIFCLINNRYGMSLPLEKAVRELDLTKRAVAYGMKALECDGNDVLQVYETTAKARECALTRGPVLLVLHTYRTCGHSKSDANLYRGEDEIAAWEAHNPIRRFSSFLTSNGIFTPSEIDDADARTSKLIEDAVEWASSCPGPDINDAIAGVYA